MNSVNNVLLISEFGYCIGALYIMDFLITFDVINVLKFPTLLGSEV